MVGKGEHLCLAPALGCALRHNGEAAPGAPYSTVAWLCPAFRQETLTFFSCVLSLGSCFCELPWLGKVWEPVLHCCHVVGQPQVSPGGEMDLTITAAGGHQIIYNSLLNESLLDWLR